MMDFNSLRIFLAVAEQGSVSRAAAALNYVQSNITTRLRNLEDDLRCQLFFRKSRGMGLTPAGERLLVYARKILLLAEEARSAAGWSEVPRGKLTIGSIETAAAIRLPPYLADYHERYPDVEISLHTGTTGQLRQMVFDYTLEGAFIGGEFKHPDIVQEELFCEEMALVTRKGYSGLEDPRVRAMIGFRQGCSYQEQVDNWLAELGRAPLKSMHFGSLEAIMGCVSAGLGASFMPRAVVEHERYGEGVIMHPVPERFSKIPTMFVRRRDMNPSSNLKPFLDMIKQTKFT